MSQNTQQPTSNTSNTPATTASKSTNTQMATGLPAVTIVLLPPVATLLELNTYVADLALHTPIHASRCSICDVYVAHLRTALADPALHTVLTTLAAAATASSEATAEVAALRSQLAHEHGAREQAKSTMKTAEDLQDQIQELEDNNNYLEAECNHLAVEESRSLRKAATTTPSQSSMAEPHPPAATKTPTFTSRAGASAPTTLAHTPHAGASLGSASTLCWEWMLDAKISAVILGEACWETGNINVAQRKLYQAVQGTPTRSRSSLVNCVLVLANEMFERSSSLDADRVAVLFPATLATKQDLENKTWLTPEHSFQVLSFLKPRDIAKDDVMRWLFEQLRVLCCIATLLLSPYFQQAERMRIARETWTHVRKDTVLLVPAVCWMDCQRNYVQQFGSADFVLHTIERISFYAEPGSRTVVWQYQRHLNALVVLDANLGWITSKVNNLLQPQYAAAVQVLEANQPPPLYNGSDASTDPDQPLLDAYGAS
ncbi:hypothetical protein FRC12_001396 [Ceratobasidium sp. 428]|nr:hypothetical protein FRC12_001396 [Ceratobasidium sp. 428]